MNPFILTVISIATLPIWILPIWIGVVNFNLVATLLGLLFVGLAIAVGFSFFMWAGVAFWLAGFVAVALAIKAREHQQHSGGEEERRNRELIAAIQTWANPHQADDSKEIPLASEPVEAPNGVFRVDVALQGS